jgi:hypothetical protein
MDLSGLWVFTGMVLSLCCETCRLLATIPQKSFKFVQPEATTTGLAPEETGHPKWDINILLVGNQGGFDNCFPNPEDSSKRLK